jgi:hypothetical protein
MTSWHWGSIVIIALVFVGAFWLGKNKPALLGGYI